MATFLELCQQVRRECGVSGTGPSSVTNQVGQNELIVDLVAKADVEIQNLWTDWRFLWATYSFAAAAGVREYSAATVTGWPADLGRYDRQSFILDADTTTETPLDVLDYRDWRDGRYNARNTQPAQVVIKPDDRLILAPTPDDIYTVSFDYWRRPARMAANADISPIPTQFHDIIAARAKMMFAEWLGAPDVQASSGHDYALLLSRLEAFALPYSAGRFQSEQDEPLVMVAE